LTGKAVGAAVLPESSTKVGKRQSPPREISLSFDWEGSRSGSITRIIDKSGEEKITTAGDPVSLLTGKDGEETITTAGDQSLF